MEPKPASALAWGLILILAGLLFLAVQLLGLPGWLSAAHAWPLIIFGIGAVLLVVGLVTGNPAMAIPACVLGGLGLLL